MRQFDLTEIFLEAFGYEPTVTDASKIDLQNARARKEESALGQPYYLKDISGVEYFMPVTINGILIPFAVVSMTWKKTIVSTAMPERGGSVKELISISDYEFGVKGIIVNEDNEYPDEWIMKLHDLFRLNESVPMRSVLSDIVLRGLGDDPEGHRVVIKQMRWPESKSEHVAVFEMELESDMIFNLEIE